MTNPLKPLTADEWARFKRVYNEAFKQDNTSAQDAARVIAGLMAHFGDRLIAEVEASRAAPVGEPK